VSLTSVIYRGHDLLSVMPNNREERDQRALMRVELLDSQTGQVSTRPAWAGLLVDHPFTWTLDGRAEIGDFLQWCAFRRGRYTPCWVPTWRQELTLAEPAGSGDTELTIVDVGYTTSLFPSEARRHLAIITATAGVRTITPRRVTDALENGDGTEMLTLEAASGIALPIDTMIAYLVLARLDSDDVELLWYHYQAAEAVVRLVELPRELEAYA
jgi:hypothetical protein